MKKYLGVIIGNILIELAKLAANSACYMLIFQPEEDSQIKSLCRLDD